jgi:hypothetical protein
MKLAEQNEETGRPSPSVVTVSRYDLAVVYRVYPKVSKPGQSLPFGDNKVTQAEICLRTFRRALGELRVKIWVILDGCPKEYHSMFKHYLADKGLVLIDLNAVGNRATFAKQLDILLSQQDAEFVYFAEDDYLYHENCFAWMLAFLRSCQEETFVSPYDHPDCYHLDLHREPKWVSVFGGHHWRTASSTCLTFLTRRSALAKYEQVFRTYTVRNSDCSLWLSLTKRRVFDPIVTLRQFARGDRYWREPTKAWLYCWPQVLLGKTAKLWVPVPAFATHLCAGLLSPGYDWLALMKEETVRSVKV